MYMGGAHQTWCGWPKPQVLHPVRRTQPDEAPAKAVARSKGDLMEEAMCAMALKSANGRQKHHTQAGLRVCCEL
jgi:hypothetical protein